MFDKNVPVPLRRSLSKHQVKTSAQLGWGQLKNGALLRTAEATGFDLMITADQNIKYQQNPARRRIALVVLGSNRWRYLQNHLPEIALAVDAAHPFSYAFVEVPLPSKPEHRFPSEKLSDAEEDGRDIDE